MRSAPLFVFAALLSGCATTTPAGPEDRRLQVVIDVPAMTRDALSRGTVAWMAKNSISVSRVIELKGGANGQIIVGHGLTDFSRNRNPADSDNTTGCSFTLTVEIREGREQLTFDNWRGLFSDRQGHQVPRPVTYAGFVRQVRSNLEALAEELDSDLKATEAK